MWKDKARMAIYAMAGVYLLILAYQMFGNLDTAGDERMIMIVFIIIFVIVGGGMTILGIVSSYRNVKAVGQEYVEAEEAAVREREQERVSESTNDLEKENDTHRDNEAE